MRLAESTETHCIFFPSSSTFFVFPLLSETSVQSFTRAISSADSQINNLFSFVKRDIQCVSVDSASFVIYPELEATEVRFSALKRYLCSFYFRIDNETGRIQ